MRGVMLISLLGLMAVAAGCSESSFFDTERASGVVLVYFWGAG